MSHIEWHPVYSYWDIDDTKPYRQMVLHNPGEVADVTWEQGEVVYEPGEVEPTEIGIYADEDGDYWVKLKDDLWVYTRDIDNADFENWDLDNSRWDWVKQYAPFTYQQIGPEKNAGE